MLELRTRVKTTIGQYGGINGVGEVVGILVNIQRMYGKAADDVYYQILHKGGQVYNYPLSCLKEIKTQTLFAYLDSTEEVHWSTKKYTEKELKSFGFKEASQFNKTIDLE